MKMAPEIIVAILSLCGTLFGTIGGIMASNKLTLYRISLLEDKVNKHNNLIERMYGAEERLTVCEHDIKELKGDIDDGK